MRSIIPDYLTEVLGDVAPDTSRELAGYIPELAAADPERLGAVFATVQGEVYGAGDVEVEVEVEFTIQSVSKPFAHALALADRGFAPVLARVGVEPSGEAFNEISLEGDTGRPRNPMINAGAITVHSLTGSADLSPVERVERVVHGRSAFAGRRLRTDEAVCASEMEHAHRNLAIAHMLRGHSVRTEDPRAVVDGYIRQCSVLVTARDLAMMAATLANRGVNPRSGERVIPEPVVRLPRRPGRDPARSRSRRRRPGHRRGHRGPGRARAAPGAPGRCSSRRSGPSILRHPQRRKRPWGTSPSARRTARRSSCTTRTRVRASRSC